MDLIYADTNRIDIGVLLDYKWDLAYGKDENDFICEISADNHVCKENYILYIEGTEYGGIIDTIELGTSSDTIIYGGRTWHGVLEGHVIEPDAGHDYYVANGEGNKVLRALIERFGLSDLFKVSAEDSGIDIVQHKIRYETGYTAIRKMLFAFEGKLKMEYKNGYVEISVVPYMDYSQDEEWDSTQLDFELKRNYRPVNHVICLGKGDLKDRKVIHLFADANGGIQPYLLKEPPIENTDYILDKRHQVMFGSEEVCQKHENSSAAEKENYVALTEKPGDWDSNYANYYSRGENEKGEVKYAALEGVTGEVFILLTHEPIMWQFCYDQYFTFMNGAYYPVTYEEEQPTYQLLTEKPEEWDKYYNWFYEYSEENEEYVEVEGVQQDEYKVSIYQGDWEENYSSYYEKYNNGIEISYKSVSGITKYKYKVQTMKPSDWAKKYASYYVKKKEGGYTSVEGVEKGKKTVAPTWKAKKYYTRLSYTVAPDFNAKTYYCKETKVVAPEWKKNKYYAYTTPLSTGAPEWEPNTYYKTEVMETAPEFIPNLYYRKTVDSYAELVKGGLEILEAAYNCDTINIMFNDNQIYDIGDVVGASDTKTGLFTWQPITKKIVKIEDNEETIDYKIGE
ncbi:MAG: hypothetical protein J6A75_07105 [Lachnospiraceae bacterium]|nr:hypothetical protein [Lachnospiraceae bacterium]